MSVKFPCRPLLVATFNPEEAGVRDHVLDRMAVCLNVDSQPLNLEQRVEAMQGVLDWSNFSDEELMEIDRQEQALTTRILFAREYFKTENKISTAQIKYLCEETTRAGCQVCVRGWCQGCITTADNRRMSPPPRTPLPRTPPPPSSPSTVRDQISFRAFGARGFSLKKNCPAPSAPGSRGTIGGGGVRPTPPPLSIPPPLLSSNTSLAGAAGGLGCGARARDVLPHPRSSRCSVPYCGTASDVPITSAAGTSARLVLP